jgi:hypothetical protein
VAFPDAATCRDEQVQNRARRIKCGVHKSGPRARPPLDLLTCALDRALALINRADEIYRQGKIASIDCKQASQLASSGPAALGCRGLERQVAAAVRFQYHRSASSCDLGMVVGVCIVAMLQHRLVWPG